MGISVQPHATAAAAPSVEAVQPAFADMSAIICTRDRTAQLERALKSLFEQELPPAEILVVDNAPADDSTRLLVEHGFPDARYIREPVPGLDFARNRALHESGQTIVAFLDDDVVADCGWSRSMMTAFEKNPLAAACIGRVEALTLETEAQRLFEANGGFSRGNERICLPRDVTKPLHGRRAPLIAWAISVGSGCSLALRREVALEIGGFDEALDLGSSLPGGGDHDILWRVLKAGHEVVYEPEALAWHEHRKEMAAAFHQIVGHQRALTAFLTKSVIHSRGGARLPVFAFLAWRLIKPAVRITRRAVGRDPLPATLLLRILWNAWLGLGAYPLGRRIAHSRRQQATRAREQLDRANSHRTPSGEAAPVRTAVATSAASPEESGALLDACGEAQHELGAPLVSVIIPCYNQAHFLAEAIESVVNQIYRHFEIVVVDDGSTDDTSKIAARFPGVRYIKQENQGLAAARNLGIQVSRGNYLVFLDADDRLLPTALDAGLNCFATHPKCAFVSGAHIRIAHDGSPLTSGDLPHDVDRDHYFAMLHKNYIQMHATVMYRRDVLLSLNGFDASLGACEDYDLFLRITRNYPVHCHDHVVAEYRMHDAQMSRNALLMLQTAMTVLGSQWPYVKADRRYRRAYKAGARFWRYYYGKKLVKQVLYLGARGQAKQALQAVTILLRYAGVSTMLRNAPLWFTEITARRLDHSDSKW